MHEWRVCSSDRGAEMCDRSPHLTRSSREGSKPHSSMRYLTIFLWPWTTALWRQFWPKLSRSNLLSPKQFTRYFTHDSLPLIADKWRALSRSCVWGIEPSYHWWWRWWRVDVNSDDDDDDNNDDDNVDAWFNVLTGFLWSTSPWYTSTRVGSRCRWPCRAATRIGVQPAWGK